jgi:peptidoglycan/LPS O-acetylase OafA/YrhL
MAYLRMKIFRSTISTEKDWQHSLTATADNILTPIKNKHRFEELDGLRAVACFIVLMAHFGPQGNWKSSIFTLFKTLLPGELGVMTFFCLSSFLITLLLLEEHAETKKINVIKFLIKRSLRIWPLYFFSIFFILAYTKLIFPVTEWMHFKEYSNSLIFIANWFPLSADISVLWSVCVEEQFYIILPIIIALSLKNNKVSTLMIAGCILLGCLWRIFYIQNSSHFAIPMYYLTPTYIDCFVYGVLTAWIYKNKINFFSFSKSNTFSVLMIILLMLICNLGGRGIWWGPYNNYITVFSYGLMPIVICLLIISLIVNKNKSISRFLGTNIIRTLGVLSFGTYIWHVFCINYIINFQVNRGGFLEIEPNEFLYCLLFLEYCSLCVLCSALTFKYIEKPFLRLRNRIYSENFSKHQVRWDLAINKTIFVSFISFAFILFIFFYTVFV